MKAKNNDAWGEDKEVRSIGKNSGMIWESVTTATELGEMRQRRKQSGQQEIVRLQANKILFIAAAELKKRDKMIYIDGIHVMVAGMCIHRCNI
jgi:hypothetical protein